MSHSHHAIQNQKPIKCNYETKINARYMKCQIKTSVVAKQQENVEYR